VVTAPSQLWPCRLQPAARASVKNCGSFWQTGCRCGKNSAASFCSSPATRVAVSRLPAREHAGMSCRSDAPTRLQLLTRT
jgi:hypothetical protein